MSEEFFSTRRFVSTAVALIAVAAVGFLIAVWPLAQNAFGDCSSHTPCVENPGSKCVLETMRQPEPCSSLYGTYIGWGAFALLLMYGVVFLIRRAPAVGWLVLVALLGILVIIFLSSSVSVR